MTTTTTFEFVYFEAAPYVTTTALDGYGRTVDKDEIASAHLDLPEPFLAQLRELLVNADRSCYACADTPVGFVLITDLTLDREYVEWQPTGLVRQDGGPVVALCEDCSPREIAREA